MKITEDTKIKDIIPEGWELKVVEFAPPVYLEESLVNNIGQVCIPLVKKPEKEFRWYYGEYMKLNRESRCPWLTKEANDYSYDLFVGENYDDIEFEVKIGLLKFICDDIKLSLYDMYHYLRVYYVDDMPSKFDTIYSIVPSEFMDSLTD